MTERKDMTVTNPQITSFQVLIDGYDKKLAHVRIEIAMAQINENGELEQEAWNRKKELLKKRNSVVDLKFKEIELEESK